MAYRLNHLNVIRPADDEELVFRTDILEVAGCLHSRHLPQFRDAASMASDVPM